MATKIFCQFLIIVISVYALPHNYNEENICGYQNCPKTDPNNLNIHIVPHSHDDVGWLKTVDQYYHGSNSSIQHAGVQFILDSAIQALLNNPERRFIYVETAFFWKWWKQQDNNTRDQVKYLVNNGQLEIIGGAWSMNDEAAVHYQSTIDQFTWGFRKLNETLGDCARPKIGWQIDPFGHSREQASLFSQFGFDGLFFARLDYRDKDQRLATKTAEMLWQGSQSLGKSSQIFTHVLYNHYMTPPGFCFDVMCPDEPIVIDKESPGYNAKTKAQIFLNFCKEQATHYRTNNVIITMGGDFHYQDSLSYFKNMDFLIRAMREEDSNIKVFYSSPSCYLKAVHEANLDWTVKTDDFFPYASDPNSYWTGYFSSRPTSKRFERLGNNILQITKQLSALAFTNSFNKTLKLDQLREVMGIMQHHDAITGTEKQHVADDYHRMLTTAIHESANLANEALKKLNEPLEYKSCLLLNISQCDVSESNENFLITIYNPLSRPVSHFMRIPVVNESYEVFDSVGNKVQSQIVPIFELIQNIPGRDSEARNELVFQAKEIPPLGSKLFTIKYVPEKAKVSDDYSGLYENIQVKENSILLKESKIAIKSSFYYYNGENGNNMIAKNRSSGAYIFRPKEKEAVPVKIEEEMKQYNGAVVMETHQKYNSWLGLITRLYSTDFRYIEYNWVAGPLPVEENDKIGKEIVARYHISFDNEAFSDSSSNEFFTDSNGREMIKRIRDYRSSFNLTNEEPVSQNYYPITSKISIRSDKRQMQASILNDRAQGGSSLHEGELELMIHRRLLKDDAFGVEEALNERAFQFGLVAVGKHYFTSGYFNNSASSSIPNAEVVAKELEKEILLAPWIFITPLNEAETKDFRAKNLKNFEKSGLKNPLSRNIQILTLEPWADNTILLRLEHILEKGDDPKYSIPVTVDIQELFSSFKIDEIQEMNLGANQLNSEVVRLQWKAVNDNENKNTSNKEEIQGSKVTLNPMEIKTFVIKVSALKN